MSFFKMMKKSKCFVNISVVFVLCVIYSHTCSAVIYELNETEYKRMPPVFHVDPYEECSLDPGGVYCLLEIALVADGRSALMDLITEYSAHTVGHYNHSLLRYNLCITNMCTEFYNDTTSDLVMNLEACLNKTFEEKYGLKTKLSENVVHCKKVNKPIQVEIADYFIFVALIGILVINTVGSLYDVICTNGNKGEGNDLLTSFSIRLNWRKLVGPSYEGPDSRLERLQGLSCLKFISTVFVVLAHTSISSIFYIDNTKFMEDLYKNVIVEFLGSATIVVQTFFLSAGFLLSYNLELMSEKNNSKLNWMLIPKSIILRWIRLTPPYALALFYIITLNKYVITGPHWHYAAAMETVDCQRYWWQHLLYINNYNDESLCMLHTWYLASDFQLSILGLVICVTCRSAASRKVVLSVLLVVSIIIPVAHTYWQDLDGMLVATPEVILRFFLGDPTFTHLYKRGHTNMFSYLMGLSVGFLAYHGQKVNFDVQKYKIFRILFYSMIPLGTAMVLSGCVFFRDAPRPSLAVRMLFAAYQKPVWGLFLGIGMLAVIFKYEAVIRGVVEWHGWTPLSRLSYCAYFLHIPIIRIFVASNGITHPTYISMTQNTASILVATYLVALPLWLLVEQPTAQLLALLRLRTATPDQHVPGPGNERTDRKIEPDTKKLI